MATIGPRDGIQYTVIGVREEQRMAIQCGFNDTGLPNGGKFSIETRAYEEWSNGNLLRSWQEDVENFIGCVEV